MIYFTDWWSYGENCIIQTFNGVLAGDKKMNDTCIYEKDTLKIFLDSIAKEVVIDSGERGQITEKNKDDVFLNKKVNLDFKKNILFVFCEANVKEIVYSKMFECYLISYSEEPAEANTYSAVLVKKLYPRKSNSFLINYQENEEVEFEKAKTMKDGHLKIDEKIMKDFKPKFETMNDKPKPKRGKYLKSYNDDY